MSEKTGAIGPTGATGNWDYILQPPGALGAIGEKSGPGVIGPSGAIGPSGPGFKKAMPSEATGDITGLKEITERVAKLEKELINHKNVTNNRLESISNKLTTNFNLMLAKHSQSYKQDIAIVAIIVVMIALYFGFDKS